MRDKKHIDRLFQERFKDFEATPNDVVWDNIEAELNKKKKKRRVIPIWWRYAGVAALLLILLTVGSLFFNESKDIPTNQVVDTENTTRSSQNTEGEKKDNSLNNLTEKDQVVTNTESEKDTLEKILKNINTENPSDKIKALNKTTVAETTNSINENKGSEKGNNSNSILLNNKQKTLNSIVKSETSNIATNTSEEKNIETIEEVESIIDTKKVEAVLNNNSKNTSTLAENEMTKTNALVDDTNKNNGLSIEDVLDKTKEIIEEEEYLNRWSVTPNAAPVYFNSLGEGSSIDPQFNSNSKSGELNMSYGITASYAINNKLSIRSGIHKVNLGYNTNDVIVFQSISASSKSSSLQNVNTTNNVNNLEAASFTEGVSLISGANLKNADSFTKSSITSINQSLGYIEIPIEIQYAISTKKFGVNLIGGFSSLFLNSNKVFSDFGDSRTLLGEANNINKVSYSANFGLGFNYKMSKTINLNLEPIFKYQINTFNNTSGDFKPYFIGVYTGFAIKF